MYFEDEGRGMPVLFIHGGFGGVESTLFPQRSVFTGVLPPESFRTITYARRNSGRSGYSSKAYKVSDLAADARGLLDHLGIDKAYVVGDSLGGLVAMTFALRWPERISSLVLVETATHIVRSTGFTRAVLAASYVLPQRLIFKLFKRRILMPPEYDPVGPQSPETQAARAAQRVQYLKKLQEMPEDELLRYSIGLFHSYAAFVGYDISDQVSKIKLPVDIVHGTADRVVPFPRSQQLHSLIPQSTLLPIESAGHGLFYYEPGRELVRRLLEDHGS